jgi:hypothetical protein
MHRLTWIALLVLLSGCAESFEPQIAGIAPPIPNRLQLQIPARASFSRQYLINRSLGMEHHRLISILVMAPAYGTLQQIRAGNMGHAAIEIEGRLHDMGSLNGYAFTLAPSRAVRDWSFEGASQAVSSLISHPDADGYLDEITRFDVTVTDVQEAILQSWWRQMESAMDDANNKLYCWTRWQCASAVGESLRDAGITFLSPTTPQGLRDYLKTDLRNTCGENCGASARMIICQKSACLSPKAERHDSPGWEIIWKWPAMFFAGHRSNIFAQSPDRAFDQVLWSDSEGFHKRAQAARISPETAVLKARELGPVPGAQIVPNFSIGPWYHIAADHVIGQASLGGMYVNANTAAVVRLSNQQVIRFDLFNDDRIVNAWSAGGK